MKIGKNRPIPPSLIVILLLGDAAVFWISRTSLYPAFGVSHSIWADVAMLLGFNVALLFIRDRYPKVWEMMTTEKAE